MKYLSMIRASKHHKYYCDTTSTNSLLRNLVRVWDYLLKIKDLLPSEVIGQALKELKIRYKQRLFDPLVTLWAFLSQVLEPDKSCHNAVSKVITYWAGTGVEIPSTEKARLLPLRGLDYQKSY